MLKNVYDGLNAQKCIWRHKCFSSTWRLENVYAEKYIWRLKCLQICMKAHSKVFLSKVYFCKVYPTCVSSKLRNFIYFDNVLGVLGWSLTISIFQIFTQSSLHRSLSRKARTDCIFCLKKVFFWNTLFHIDGVLWSWSLLRRGSN